MRGTRNTARRSDAGASSPSRVRRIRASRPSPALVISLIALFVALGGTSYALVVTSQTVKDNSLTSADVKNNSLTGSDIADNSVTSADVRNGTLRARDFLPGELPGGGGTTGTAGPAGPAGPTGPAGSALAFAHVAGTGAVDPATSKGITLVSRKSAGVYCLDFTAGTPKNILAFVDISGADSVKARVAGTAVAAAVTPNCPAGADMLIATASDGLGNADLPFYLAVIA